MEHLSAELRLSRAAAWSHQSDSSAVSTQSQLGDPPETQSASMTAGCVLCHSTTQCISETNWLSLASSHTHWLLHHNHCQTSAAVSSTPLSNKHSHRIDSAAQSRRDVVHIAGARCHQQWQHCQWSVDTVQPRHGWTLSDVQTVYVSIERRGSSATACLHSLHHQAPSHSDRRTHIKHLHTLTDAHISNAFTLWQTHTYQAPSYACLLYTSDAADE